MHLLEEEVSDAVDEPNDAVDGRILRVAEVENVIPLAFSIDDVLGNDDFHETMDDGVSIHPSIAVKNLMLTFLRKSMRIPKLFRTLT
jgi:hypothetical protein